MRRRHQGLVLLAAAALIPALALPTGSAMGSAPPASSGPSDTSLASSFTAASQRYGVPEQVLLAVSYAYSRWDDHGASPSTSGGYGPMQLTDVDITGANERADGVTVPAPSSPAMHTLDTAAALTGLDASALKQDPAANIAGGAALLAAKQQAMGLPLGAEISPAQWYGAVAAYSGASDAKTAEIFADDVYAVLSEGATRTTNAGQRMVLPATTAAPDRSQLARTGLRAAAASGETECPSDLACEWLPAPYEWYGQPNPGAYGNHDLANRPNDMKINYIVIHDTEGSWQTTLNLVQDPTYVSWQYTMRASDGATWQHVKPNDVAWQAGNWYVNMHSIGIEHEGFAAQGSTWYTEALYRNSARLVKYLTDKYDIPIDRAHIIGHDKVPGTVPSTVAGMHWDPGPYWDWEHYFDLLGKPFKGSQGNIKTGDIVTLIPGFDDNIQVVTGCDTSGSCPPQGTNFVYLRQAPSDTAPLVKDIGLHPNGSDSTTHVSDIGARFDAGMKLVVADQSAGWLAVWYLGQKGWFRNPAGSPDAFKTDGWVVKPKPGLASVPVYGRAYPEQAAYPPEIPYAPNAVTPMRYSIAAGQAYPLADASIQTDFYNAKTFNGLPPYDHVQVVGTDKYYEIFFGHRMHFVRAADVDLTH
jgi:N-acetylmuramoyl-L-alanine amidase